METGATLRGAARLGFDAVEGATNIVEGMIRNIGALPLPFGRAPTGSAPGVAGFVHRAIRLVNSGLRDVSDLALGPLSDPLDRVAAPGPQREAVVALLNGVCGDHLERSGNPLALPLDLRVFPRPSTAPDTIDLDGAPLSLSPRSGPRPAPAGGFAPTGRILVAAHGLCMNDRHWAWQGHNHAQRLADAFDYTPVYARYNSGRHVSTNGRALAVALEDLLSHWPLPVESLTLVGFSMGGLVVRSALDQARRQSQTWIDRVDRAVYVGTPHHGAALERGGFWLQRAAIASPYTAPLAALGRIRSDGITDLRHGNVLDEDWQDVDAHADAKDRRHPAPLPPGIEHHALAATLSKSPRDRLGGLLGDGLIHPKSATGRHADPNRRLAFDQSRVRVIYGQSHLGMLSDPRVSACLEEWLAR